MGFVRKALINEGQAESFVKLDARLLSKKLGSGEDDVVLVVFVVAVVVVVSAFVSALVVAVVFALVVVVLLCVVVVVSGAVVTAVSMSSRFRSSTISSRDKKVHCPFSLTGMRSSRSRVSAANAAGTVVVEDRGMTSVVSTIMRSGLAAAREKKRGVQRARRRKRVVVYRQDCIRGLWCCDTEAIVCRAIDMRERCVAAGGNVDPQRFCGSCRFTGPGVGRTSLGLTTSANQNEWDAKRVRKGK